jgi:hypothetical protein
MTRSDVEHRMRRAWIRERLMIVERDLRAARRGGEDSPKILALKIQSPL